MTDEDLSRLRLCSGTHPKGEGQWKTPNSSLLTPDS